MIDRRGFVGFAALGAAATATAMDIQRFGVEPNREADATEDLQRAVDSGAGGLLFPKGVYRIDGTVTVDLDKTGFCSILAMGTAQIVKTGPGPAFRFIGTHRGTAGPGSFEETVWLRERMPLISGIEIVGEHEESVGLELVRTMQATITHVLIRRCRVGIHLRERNRNLIVSHCHLYHNRDLGIWFDRVNLHQVTVADSHISYNRKAGILVEGGEIRNLQICGNDIEYNHDESLEGSADVFIDASQNGATFREGVITGNTIQARPSPHGANVRIIGGKELRTAGMLAITGNMIGSQTDNIHLVDCRCVSIAGNSLYSAADRTIRLEQCDNLTVSGNSIDWNPDHRGKVMVDGIVLRECRGAQISGTIIENCFNGSEEAGGAIEIDRCEDVQLDGCQVLDPRYRGIVITASKRCGVSNCSVIDRKDPATLLASIAVDGESRDIILKSNILHKDRLELPTAPQSIHLDGNLEVEP